MGDNSQYLQMFFDESKEYIQILNDNILLLEENSDDETIINSIFRAAHSLKGMAATMGFSLLTDLTHKIENILDKIRNNELKIDTELIDLLFEGIDYISEIIDEIKKKGQEKENKDISQYLDKLITYFNMEKKLDLESKTHIDESQGEIGIKMSGEEKKDVIDNIKQTDSVYKVRITIKNDAVFRSVRGYMILKKADELGYLIKSDPEQKDIEEEKEIKSVHLILVSNLEETEIKKEFKSISDVKDVNIADIPREKLSANEKTKSNSKDSSLNKFEVSSTVRVDINKLDNLMNMVGELLINKTRMESLEVSLDTYHDILSQLDRVTMELHHIVMQIRMVPIGVMFNRFPRMVRDLSKDMGKEVDFIIEGQDTELDRSIIDELSDPIVHILRNAIDHGIEKPEVRQKKNKLQKGRVVLKAYQKGREIIIEVEDDGKGIDPESLSKKAIEKDIITAEQVEEMNKTEKLKLLFEPGLSTAEEISDVSGRGVGMDVVKKVVESLDGQVSIDSKEDEGSMVTITLPLTLAITEALMVKINKEVFAIPLSAVSETLEVMVEDVKQVKGQDVIVLRDSTVPLVESRKSLNLKTDYGLFRKKEQFPVVIINTGGRQIGLIVDKLLHQQEIVIKSLSDYLNNVENISGATIIGDGEVALILDVRNIA